MDPLGLVGTVLDGRYRIDRVLGRGGQGIVYRAMHLVFDGPVAIKVLGAAEAEGRERATVLAGFRREGQLLFRLASLHESFLQAKEAGTLLTRHGVLLPYLVLEWLDGVSLAEELRTRRRLGFQPFTLLEAARLLDRPATALSIAHSQGFSHRDLKPGNLFLARDAAGVSLRILDFGLSKLAKVEHAASEASLDRAAPFTPAYAAPEQWRAQLGALGPWTDVHAWALVFVELLSGRLAWNSLDREHAKQAALDPIRPTPGRSGVEVPARVEEIFERALALRPEDRYQDMGAFWGDLRTAVGPFNPTRHPISEFAGFREASEHEPPEPTPLAATHSTRHGPSSPVPLRLRRPILTKRGRLSIGGVGLVIAGAILLKVLSRPSHGEDRSARTVAPPHPEVRATSEQKREPRPSDSATGGFAHFEVSAGEAKREPTNAPENRAKPPPSKAPPSKPPPRARPLPLAASVESVQSSRPPDSRPPQGELEDLIENDGLSLRH